MRKAYSKQSAFSLEAWTFLLLATLSLIILFRYVDLKPHVDNDFFFSSDDPSYQADEEISQLFERNDNQLILSIAGDIFSKEYQDKIGHLTHIISSYPTVISVKSITSGPHDVHDALQSPLWKRALIPNNQKSSNIIVLLEDSLKQKVTPKVEQLKSAMQSEDFHIRISGFPYIVELIRRNLLVDLNVFSTLAFIIFSLIIILSFHSWRILVGMITTCVTAGAVSFMVNHVLGIRIGILTANLATIIFVLTLSHIVFLTFNWKHCHHSGSAHDKYSSVKEAIHHTVSASFWSMLTTFLGFLSLLWAQAKPLRELGICGALGTIIAFVAAYGIYPAFLRLKKLPHDWSERQVKIFHTKTFHFFEHNYRFLIAGIIVIILLTFPRLKELNTDPSLLSYFAKGSEITEGLEYIDKNGGSSPLVVVIKDTNNQPLNTNKTYRRLWKLQEDLEQHPDVGIVLSLPTLLAEGKRVPLSFFVSSKTLLKKMDQEKYDRIASSFITPDGKYGLFLIRMKEEGKTLHRIEIMNQIKQIVHQYQFDPHLMGGVYALQGHLSKHIATSLIYGLGRLILAFTIIAIAVSHSLRIGLAMTISLCAVPLCVLGCIGYSRIPLDTISAPASNVAIAMGIDAMIHMVHYYHRLKKRGKHHLHDWKNVQKKLWEPIITSMFIICAGFGIFFFSSFPPTQRFGGAIVFGTMIAAITALFIFPLLAKKA